MSYEVSALKRIMYQVETTASYGINLSGTSNYSDLSVLEGVTFSTPQEMLPINTVQQFIDAHQGSTPGLKSSGMTFQMYLRNNGTAASGSVIPTKPALMDVLEVAMGGYLAGTGSGFKAYSAPSSVIQTHNQTNFVGGQALCYFTSGSTGVPSKYEMNRVMQRDATHIWLYTTASSNGVVLTSSIINNTFNAYLTEDPQGSLQCHVLGREDSDSWVLAGLQGGMTIDIPIGQLATVGFDFQGCTWFTGATQTATLGAATYPTTTPLVFKNTSVTFAPTGSQQAKPQTRTELHAKTITITPNFAYTQITSPSGVEGKLRARRVRSIPAATVVIDTYFEDRTFYQAWQNRTRYALFVQLGATPGNTVYIQLPCLEIISVENIDVDGVQGQRLTLNAHTDTITTANTGFEAIARSPLVISLG